MEGKEIQRTIGDYQAHFTLTEDSIRIRLVSQEEYHGLEAYFDRNSMPAILHNVILTPEELQGVLGKLEEEDLRVSEQGELVLVLNMLGLRKEFKIKMQKKVTASP